MTDTQPTLDALVRQDMKVYARQMKVFYAQCFTSSDVGKYAVIVKEQLVAVVSSFSEGREYLFANFPGHYHGAAVEQITHAGPHTLTESGSCGIIECQLDRSFFVPES